MRKTYRASVFAGLYFGVLVVMAAIWFGFSGYMPPAASLSGALLFTVLGVLGAPSVWAHVTIDDAGIEQRFYRHWSVAWSDIITWRRTAFPDDDCDDTITLETRRGPYVLNGSCIYGNRLTEIEAELRRRLGQVPPPGRAVR